MQYYYTPAKKTQWRFHWRCNIGGGDEIYSNVWWMYYLFVFYVELNPQKIYSTLRLQNLHCLNVISSNKSMLIFLTWFCVTYYKITHISFFMITPMMVETSYNYIENVWQAMIQLFSKPYHVWLRLRGFEKMILNSRSLVFYQWFQLYYLRVKLKLSTDLKPH